MRMVDPCRASRPPAPKSLFFLGSPFPLVTHLLEHDRGVTHGWTSEPTRPHGDPTSVHPRHPHASSPPRGPCIGASAAPLPDEAQPSPLNPPAHPPSPHQSHLAHQITRHPSVHHPSIAVSPSIRSWKSRLFPSVVRPHRQTNALPTNTILPPTLNDSSYLQHQTAPTSDFEDTLLSRNHSQLSSSTPAGS